MTIKQARGAVLTNLLSTSSVTTLQQLAAKIDNRQSGIANP
jgi:hypothetical protein